MNRRLVSIGLAFLDGVISFIAVILAWKIRYSVWDTPIFTEWGYFTHHFLPYVPIIVLSPLIRTVCTWRSGGFRLRGDYSRAQDLWAIVKAAAMGSLIIVLCTGLIRRKEWLLIAEWNYHGRPSEIFAGLERNLASFEFARLVFVCDFIIYTLSSIILRVLVRLVQIRIRGNGRDLIPVIVVGEGEDAERLVSELENEPRLGRKVTARIDALDPQELLSRLRELIPKTKAEELIFSGSKLSHSQIFQLVMESEMTTPIDVKFLPDLSELVTRKLRLSQLGSMPILTLLGDPIGPVNRFLKRTIDVVIASITVLTIAIPCLITAILIKLDSKGKILFVQKRVGQDGRLFDCYKFRTMISDAGVDRHQKFMKEVIAHAKAGNTADFGEGRIFKEANDPRITWVGKMLRRYSLDEIPQILNVLKGDMSLVGPRPPIPYEVREYEDWHRGRLATRPGITGLWQVSGRNKISFEDMVRLDIYYIENYSLWLDFKILLQTIPAVLRGTGY